MILFFRCGDDHQDPTDPCQHQDLLLHLRLQQHRSEIHPTHYDDEELELNVGNADGGDDGEVSLVIGLLALLWTRVVLSIRVQFTPWEDRHILRLALD